MATPSKTTFSVAGKNVKLKDRLPLKDGAKLPELASKANSNNLLDIVPVCALLIESWEFPGNPSDTASYDDLDIFTEITPLVKAVSEYISDRLNTNPKPE